MTDIEFQGKIKELIDELKGVCANYGLGNDGNEFKIITQVFLYKFMNDKFAWRIKQEDEKLGKAKNWEEEIKKYSDEEYEMLLLGLDADTAQLKQHHFIAHLFQQQDQKDFYKIFDETLNDIAVNNSDIFSVQTQGGAKIQLFEDVAKFIADESQRNAFCRALINKLINFSFEHIFHQKYDFFATIFEYLVKDYNNDSGGKYAEYYTPHAVARIMAAILVSEEQQNVTCYDPSAGSGTLLMNLAHAIGEDQCTIYSQDISQKSSNLLRLNLILNDLVHSIPNIIQGNTILKPYHKEKDDKTLKRFNYIVSNPPFKLDFSDFRDDLDTKANHERFFAGIPKVPAKAKDKMEIYLMFIQHIMHSLDKNKGKAAIVVPTGFITAQTGIAKKIRQRLVEKKMLAGVVSMPSNIFATTGTNVSILFFDVQNKKEVVLIDASKLGDTVKEGKNQRTVLAPEEEQKIIDTFNNKKPEDDFSVVVSYDEITEKNYSFSAGQYFEVKIEYIDITHEEFTNKMTEHKQNLRELFAESKQLEIDILNSLEGLEYE